MEILKYSALCLAPGLFWLWFFRRKDDHEPEPIGPLLAVFALGGASVLLVIWIRPLAESLLPSDPGLRRTVADAFLATALVEESTMLLVLGLIAWRLREFDEPLDGIIYGAAVALGFASIENMLYLFQNNSPSLALMRAFTATLGHVAFTGSMGFFIGLATFASRGRRIVLVPAALLVPVLLHGSYDCFLLVGSPLAYVSLLLLLPLMLYVLGLMIRNLRARSPRYHP